MFHQSVLGFIVFKMASSFNVKDNDNNSNIYIYIEESETAVIGYTPPFRIRKRLNGFDGSMFHLECRMTKILTVISYDQTEAPHTTKYHEESTQYEEISTNTMHASNTACNYLTYRTTLTKHNMHKKTPVT